MTITISIGQMDVQRGDPAHNTARVREWTAEAARRGSDLVVFPELWDTSYALDRAQALGSPVGAGRFAEVEQLAQEHHIHIVGSMMEFNTSGHAYNTAVWFTPQGASSSVYRKLHLFRLMHEEQYLAPGPAPIIHPAQWGPTGLAICYDLRFPELFRGYALAGAVMTIIPAQWPHPRMAHWQTLLRARAIENQMVVVGCNRVGEEDGVRFGGRSAIIDAWGEPAVEADESEVLLTADVDLDHVARVREKIPVFDDRRPDVY